MLSVLTGPKTIKRDISTLKNEGVKENVKTAIQNHLENLNLSPSPDEAHDTVILALNKGKEKVPPQPKQQRQTIPWTSDTELTRLHHNRVELRKQQDSNNIKERLKEIRKKIKLRVKAIQNKILKEKAKELNEAKQHRNMVKMWRNAKSHGSSVFQKSAPIQ